MDNLGQEIAQQLIAENTLTVSLFPGAFKPPTRSHFQIVENAAKISDEVRIIIANNIREGYTPEISFKIWKQYAKLLPENVNILIAKNSSPITEIYDIVKEKSNNYIVIYGKGEQDRYNSINENRDKYSNVEIVDAGNIGDISATKLREAISKRNKLAIKSLIPEGIKVNDFLLNFQIHEIKVNKPSLFPSELLPIKDKLDHYIKYEQPASPEIKAANIFPYILKLNKNGDINISELSIENFKPGYAGNLIKRLATYIKNQHLDEDKIPGGLAKGKSLIDIAKHHRVPQADIYKQLQKGIKIEMEHTTSKEIAKEIAMDHLWEDPKYYNKLDSIEEIKINTPQPTPLISYEDTPNNKRGKIIINFSWGKETGWLFTHEGNNYYILVKHKLNNPHKFKDIELIFKKYFIEHVGDSLVIDLKNYPNISDPLDEIKVNKPFPSFPITLTSNEQAKEIGEKLFKLGYKAEWEDDRDYFNYFPFKQFPINFEPIILTTNGKELEWNTVEHQNHVEDDEDIIFEIGKQEIQKVLGEIKVNKPGLNFPIKIETPEQAQKIGKILNNNNYLWDDGEVIDLDSYPFMKDHFNPFIINKGEYDNTISSKIQPLEYPLYESIQINPKLYVQLLNKLVEDCCKELEIQKPVIKLINNDKYTLENKSYAGYFPSTNEIKVVIYGRNLADSCRSLSHELKHAQQQSKGELTQNAGEDGDTFENEANSFSGKKMREFGRKHPEIYFMKYDKN